MAQIYFKCLQLCLAYDKCSINVSTLLFASYDISPKSNIILIIGHYVDNTDNSSGPNHYFLNYMKLSGIRYVICLIILSSTMHTAIELAMRLKLRNKD